MNAHQNTHLIVFTDMDGTLLDHDNYQYTAAEPALALLKEKCIPLVLVSSKTAAELKGLREALDLDYPFIVENGAALYLPKSQFDQPENALDEDDFWVIGFSFPRSYWCLILAEVARKLDNTFTSFSLMGIGEIARTTGLSVAQAALANQREYSEPVWFYGDAEKKRQFIELVEARGATVLEGGRFLHLTNGFTKGDAVTWLVNHYGATAPNQRTQSIGLGDSHNDIGMLEVVDYPVLVKSPVHDFPAVFSPNLLKTSLHGPAGWNEAIGDLVKRLTTEDIIREV